MSAPPADLEHRHIVITGANTGIGAATTKELAARGAHVVLACRSREKTEPVLGAIRAAGGSAEFVALDLGSLASVRQCADALLAQGRPIDVLLNNAGVAGQRGITADGFELHFGTNHVGHFLLTMRVMPLLRAAPAARIVNVSSKSHYRATGIDFNLVKRYTRTISGLREYEVSKLANVLFTKELARRLSGSTIHSYALHPGVVASDVWRRIPWPLRPFVTRKMLTIEEGARTSLYCATSPEVRDHDGRYYDACKERAPNEIAEDAGLARRLWDESVKSTCADLSAKA
jgi:NAD(P)-dependent dehydrogenase (short-subunit alcohol dehydrogenase family)